MKVTFSQRARLAFPAWSTCGFAFGDVKYYAWKLLEMSENGTTSASKLESGKEKGDFSALKG